jgi:hypothetical protein
MDHEWPAANVKPNRSVRRLRMDTAADDASTTDHEQAIEWIPRAEFLPKVCMVFAPAESDLWSRLLILQRRRERREAVRAAGAGFQRVFTELQSYGAT